MNLSEMQESTSTTGWRTVTDLFEQFFGPDSDVSKDGNILDKEDPSTVATETSQNSYTTLNTYVQGQRLNITQQSNNRAHNDTVEEFLEPNSDSLPAMYSVSDLNRANVTLVLDNTQLFQPTEETTTYLTIPQPSRIDHRDLLKRGRKSNLCCLTLYDKVINQ